MFYLTWVANDDEDARAILAKVSGGIDTSMLYYKGFACKEKYGTTKYFSLVAPLSVCKVLEERLDALDIVCEIES